MQTFADVEQVLSQTLPGYEPRPSQRQFAQAIEGFFAQDAPEEDPRGFFGHGPVGLGKSLAALIPAVLSGKRVVYSVTTKALQDQLQEVDLPFLSEHLPPFTWAVLKGRSSYLCLQRTQEAGDGDVAVPVREIAQYAQEAEGFTGLRDELPMELTDQQWSLVCSDADDCKAMECQPEDCYAARARARARESRIVVVNHALLFTDLAIKVIASSEGYEHPGMIGEYDYLICDEAHELAHIATDSLGSEFSLGSFRHLTGSLRKWASRYGKAGSETDLEPHLSATLSAATRLFDSLPVPETGEFSGSRRIELADVERMADEFVAMLDALGNLGVAFKSLSVHSSVDRERAMSRRGSLLSQTRNAWTKVQKAFTDPFTETVRWIETTMTRRGGEARKVIKSRPIDVSDYLGTYLYSQTPVAMISGTLAVKGGFDFHARELGVRKFSSCIADSPYDYASQSRLYIPTHLPAPVGRDIRVWESMAQVEISEVIKAARGRTLVLFTSKRHMEQVYKALTQTLPYEIRMQGQGSIRELSDWFRANPEGVLLGSRSFMTGFDVRGESLSAVVLAKLPFPVPTEPVTQAKCEAIEAAGGNSFNDYTVPGTSLVLQQALGRLIRHTTDMGVAVVLDPRMQTKHYGKWMMRDLPPMQVVTDFEDVSQFLERTREHFEAQAAVEPA